MQNKHSTRGGVFFGGGGGSGGWGVELKKLISGELENTKEVIDRAEFRGATTSGSLALGLSHKLSHIGCWYPTDLENSTKRWTANQMPDGWKAKHGTDTSLQKS